MSHPLHLRWNTQDVLACVEVLDNNEYRLPERFGERDVILDVGANIGVFAHACLTRGAGKVVCFEPEPSNFKMLRMNMAPWEDQAETHRAAVWHTTQPLMMTVKPATLSAMHHTLGGGDVKVQAVALQPFLNEPIRLLKLDCEGAEKAILDGVQSLANVQEVIGEIHYQMCQDDHDPPSDAWLRRRLGELGFRTILIERSVRAPQYLALFFAQR